MKKFLQIWIIFALVMGLNACQTLNNSGKTSDPQSKELQPGRYAILKDFAPSGPIPAFFKTVIPKAEPLSRYGNPTSYRVGDKTYYVMRTGQGYHQKGLASWYASKFHKQRTSSGEPYDMYALTAAHRTLPLPSYLRVTNLQNGRQIIVRVNDRGPFHSDRLIDLSYGAAVKLGIFPKGTAAVDIEAIGAGVTAHATMPSKVGPYFLQVGAFQSYASANQFKVKAANLSHHSVVIERKNGRYLVQIGPFAGLGQSEQMKKILARQGLSGSFSVMH